MSILSAIEMSISPTLLTDGHNDTAAATISAIEDEDPPFDGAADEGYRLAAPPTCRGSG